MNIKTFAVIVILLMYVLSIVFRAKKLLFTGIAVLIVVAAATVFPDTVFPLPQDVVALEGKLPGRIYAVYHSVFEIINWNMILIYLGSMIISSTLVYSKVPERIAGGIINRSGNACTAVAALIAIAGILSAFTGSMPVVLIMAPVALALCSGTGMNPTVPVIGIAAVSNFERAATLVGSPASMIFAGCTGYGFNEFFVHKAKLSVFFVIQAGMIAGCILFYIIFFRERKKTVRINSENVVSWIPLIFLLIMIFGLVSVSFINMRFEYMTGIIAAGAGILCLTWFVLSQKNYGNGIAQILKILDWKYAVFIACAFVVTGAMKETGALDAVSYFLVKLSGGHRTLGFLLILMISLVMNAFADNVLYITAMLPVAVQMSARLGVNQELYIFALLIGSCLGGNLTPFSSDSNIAAAEILEKSDYPVKFSGWLKTGGAFTVITAAVSSVILWILWA